jgi:type II secretory pathway component GspD/PulD (secretin)
MNRKTFGFLVAGLLAPAIFGQTPTLQNRDFHLTHATTAQELQEIANGIKVVAEIRDMSVDNAQMSFTMRGTAEQLALVEWSVGQLDQPVDATIPSSPQYKGLTDTDAQGQTVTNGVAQVFYFPHEATVKDFQEAANAVRSVTETRRVATYNDGRAMLVRGTPEQLAMIEWTIGALRQSSPAPEFQVGANDVMRVFSVAKTDSEPDFQELANGVRTIVEIRRMATIATPRAVVTRSTPNQMAMAAWLLAEMDKPVGGQSGQYSTPGLTDGEMRVFHIVNAKSVQDFQAIGNAVRTGANTRWVATSNAQRALAVRGTANQLALAEKLVHDLDVPSR